LFALFEKMLANQNQSNNVLKQLSEIYEST